MIRIFPCIILRVKLSKQQINVSNFYIVYIFNRPFYGKTLALFFLLKEKCKRFEKLKEGAPKAEREHADVCLTICELEKNVNCFSLVPDSQCLDMLVNGFHYFSSRRASRDQKSSSKVAETMSLQIHVS